MVMYMWADLNHRLRHKCEHNHRQRQRQRDIDKDVDIDIDLDLDLDIDIKINLRGIPPSTVLLKSIVEWVTKPSHFCRFAFQFDGAAFGYHGHTYRRKTAL